MGLLLCVLGNDLRPVAIVFRASKCSGEIQMTNNKYVYKVYGLIIGADFPIPEFIEFEGRPEVIIKYGKVKSFLENPEEKGIRFEATKDEFLLTVEGIAKYYVSNGREIIIEPYDKTNLDVLRVFLHGSVFGALLHQKQYLVLHGSSIVVNGSGIVFAGDSGSGKSTLAAAFYRKRYKILTDDLCVVKLNNAGIPEVVPGFPKLKLWKDSIKLLGENINLLEPIRNNLQKYWLDIESEFSKESVPMSKMYIMHNQNNSELRIEQIPSTQKLKELINNTYRWRYIKKTQEGKSLYFEQILATDNAIDIYKITRDIKLCNPDQMLTILEKEMK